MLKKLDRDNKIPLFVVDAVGLSRLQRINAEDINYVAVTERLTNMFNKINCSIMPWLPIQHEV